MSEVASNCHGMKLCEKLSTGNGTGVMPESIWVEGTKTVNHCYELTKKGGRLAIKCYKGAPVCREKPT